MRTFTNSELKFMEDLMGLSQDSLKLVLYKFLNKYYKNVIYDPDFVMAKGDIPITLVAHMDTVFKTPPKEIYYDKRKNVMISPTGLGADDRAGIFAITYILQTTNLRPHIIFTTDEEIGCVGASELALYECPFDELKYIIQLDRRGANDCVFYDCDNPAFEEYIESFGFVANYGTFTDITELCPAWEVAGVNLSIGYKNEHTTSEVLFVGQMFDTIKKVVKMLSAENIPYFKYVPAIYLGKADYYDPFQEYELTYKCKGCDKLYPESEVLPVKLIRGGVGYYCENCIVKHVDWCRNCGEAFQIDSKSTEEECPQCEKKMNKKIKEKK